MSFSDKIDEKNIHFMDPNQALYDNIHLLEDLLLSSLKAQLKPEIIKMISVIAEEARMPYKTDPKISSNAKSNTKSNANIHVRNSKIETAIHYIWNILEPLNSETLLALARTFSQYLTLTNIAEQYHRIRRRRWHQEALHPAQPGSLEAVFPTLLQAGISKETLFQTVSELNIELVLTAHPTEVTRRTLIHKHNEIAKYLEELDRQNLNEDEQDLVILRLHEVITALCRTIEIRPKKPSVIEEAKWGFAVVEGSLWQALPNYLRDLNRKLYQITHQTLPIDKIPLRIASWMGGDRDGNPNVTAAITRKVIFMSRKVAAELYYKDIATLHESLSLQECNDELRALVGDVLEPYRRLLHGVKEKLLRTKYWAECQLEERELCPSSELVYLKNQDFLEPLLICHRSLYSIGAQILADGQLLDVIRRVHAFGLTLMPIDIRQNAEKHTALMDALTESLYGTWLEKDRQAFLLKMILNENNISKNEMNENIENIKKKLGTEDGQNALAILLNTKIQKRNVRLSEELEDYLEIFRVIAENVTESFGAYVISMAAKPSDVLLVYALQKACGMTKPIRIVPLFETLEDLNSASTCMEALFNIPVYRDACDGKQEVMIGYSDSAKDAGFMAASWAQYRAQEALTTLSQKYNIRISFFHGRGGSVGRGGGPSYLAIRSQPPGSIHGGLRVTQQGEVIRYRFGLQKIAERTLAIYTTATLEATLLPAHAPEPDFRRLMDYLSETSTTSYRNLVDNPDFLKYFASVTPIAELDKMTIGSRPTRRQQSQDISSLRAIPWVFAWIQNRLILPSWYGVGDAFKRALKIFELQDIEKARKEWAYFASILAVLEIGLEKVDINISKEYEKHLATKNLWPLGEALRTSYEETKNIIQTVLQENEALSKDPVLQRSIAVRSPYLLILHLLQITLLEKAKKKDFDSTADEFLEQAILVSITGIAAGMLNTG